MIFNVKSSGKGVTEVRMEIQSYAGTDLYGEVNPCVLTFSFTPKVIMFVGAMVNGIWYGVQSLSADKTNVIAYVDKVITDTLTTSYTIYNGFYVKNAFLTSYIKKSKDGKTIMWYNTENAYNQLNRGEHIYYFMALG